MGRSEVLSKLREHESALRTEGIVGLSLFGSAARDAATSCSDIDLLATFDRSRQLSLIDILRLQAQLSTLLEHPVDLIEEGTLKPRVRAAVSREAVRAF